MTPKLLHLYAQPDAAGLELLRNAMNRLNLSARAYDRILKVSRTIADLEGSNEIRPEHLAEARTFGRGYQLSQSGQRKLGRIIIYPAQTIKINISQVSIGLFRSTRKEVFPNVRKYLFRNSA